jgi:hypothetical protein
VPPEPSPHSHATFRCDPLSVSPRLQYDRVVAGLPGRVRVTAPQAGNITVIRCKYIGGLVPFNPADVPSFQANKSVTSVTLHKDDSYLQTGIYVKKSKICGILCT